MKNEEIDRKIGMPDVDREWEMFRQEVIGPTASHGKSVWRKAAAVVGIVFGVTLVVMASVVTINYAQSKQAVIDTSVEDKPLVEYSHGKGARWGGRFIVNLCPGVYVNHVKGKGLIPDSIPGSYIEDTFFRYAFYEGSGKLTMMLDGAAFDKEHLPRFTNKVLKKMEITHGSDQSLMVNLLTTDDQIPLCAKSNAIREHTLFLHADGRLGICKGQGTKGDWIRHSAASWEKDRWGRSVRDEILPSLRYADYKLYVYIGQHTPQVSIERVEKLIREMKIPHYEFVRDLPAVCWTDAQYRAWAQEMKKLHPQYDYNLLFNELAKENVDDDLRGRWHIVKQVYGVK